MKMQSFFAGLVPALLFVPCASAAELDRLPGKALWQPYLQNAPQTAEEFVSDPLAALWQLLPEPPLQMLAGVLHQYAGLLLFLALAAVLSFLVGEHADRGLLELAAAGGCGVLAWNDLMTLAGTVCEKIGAWKLFLANFLPIYSGVMIAGGEYRAGAAAGGFLLSGLCILAQCAAVGISPLLQSYLAVSMASCISTQKELAEVCRALGGLLRKALSLLGKALAVLLGVQRIITLQLDRTTMQLGQLLTGSVPIIGQTLSGAADTVLAGFQLLKSSLGIAALLILGAEFVPLYAALLLHLLLLSGCGVFCELAGSSRCRALFDCMCEAVRCMAAVTALFFELIVVGVVLMMAVGGG